MNQLVENFCNHSLARKYCEDMGNFISYVSSKYGVNIMPTKYFVILGAFSLFIYVLNRKPSVPKLDSSDPPRSKSLILREIHSGNALLDRLVEDNYKISKLNPATLNNAENLLKVLLNDELLNFDMLQQTVAKLEMSAKVDIAMKLLQDAKEKAYKAGKSHEAYEIEMLLIEVRIYKGEKEKLEEALNSSCLQHDPSFKDARRPLYKAIIHLMLEQTEEARKHWEEFITVREPVLNAVLPETDFEKFKDRVQQHFKLLKPEK